MFSAGSVERILPRFARPLRVKTSNRGAMMYDDVSRRGDAG